MIDVPTLLGCSAAFLLCMSLLILATRPHSSAGWFAMPLAAGALGCAFLVQPQVFPGRLGLQLGAFSISLAYAFAWQAARAFRGAPPRWGLLLAPSAIWLLLSIVLFGPREWAWASAVLRITLVALYTALAAGELWRQRSEGMPSIRRLAILLMAVTALALVKLPFAHWLPQPLGGAPSATWAVVVYNVQILVQVLLAAGLAVSMHKERAALQVYHQSIRDPMTGLYNRRFFEQRAAEWDARGPTRRRAVLYFDIDHFKRINDRFGHTLGDAVIVEAAQVAQRTLRKGDWIFRFGGEEFVCVLPDTGLDEARASAERLREAFSVAAAQVHGHRVGATISIGVAAFVDGGGIEQLLAEADRRLYAAKAAGRNRVVAGDPCIVPDDADRRRVAAAHPSLHDGA